MLTILFDFPQSILRAILGALRTFSILWHKWTERQKKRKRKDERGGKGGYFKLYYLI